MHALRSPAFLTVLSSFLLASAAPGEDQWVVYDGFDGPGKGKHIVLVSGYEEYRWSLAKRAEEAALLRSKEKQSPVTEPRTPRPDVDEPAQEPRKRNVI